MTVIMIEHDIGVVMDISHRLIVLDFGRKIAEGQPHEVIDDPAVKKAYLGEDEEPAAPPIAAPAVGEVVQWR
jgi:branched-chain amino acid transport system ATP-binding protein